VVKAPFPMAGRALMLVAARLCQCCRNTLGERNGICR
jgi:hypothetical protein